MLAVMVSSYLVIAARIVGRNKPMEDTKALHVTKRQSSSICLLFYLDEPPDFLKCNPQNNSMLRLRCKFLVGDGSPDNPPIPFSMGWFFSSDGRVADLVNANPFTISPLTAYESVLVVSICSTKSSTGWIILLQVLNALPGAYFCSTGNNNLILDSNVLRVDNKTLQQVCLPQEAPVLQTPPPRCIQPGIPTPRVIPFPTTEIVVTDTIDFGGGVEIPTPTYSIKLERNILVESTVLTMTMTATPQVILKVNNITGAGVGLGVGITLAVVVIPLLIILSVICLIKRKKNNKKSKSKCQFRAILMTFFSLSLSSYQSWQACACPPSPQ